MDTTKQTIISIATGFGGLESGLKRAGIKIKVAAYVEIEAFIMENLVAAMDTNQLDTAPIWADVKTFPHQSFYRKIHGITAGYPCQPFSTAGKRTGNEDPRHIFPHILKIIKSVEPIWCFFENVEGHLSMGYEDVYRSLHNLGYKIEAGIYSAEEVGAPHQRKRMYILAIKMEYSDASTIERLFFRNEKKQPNIRSTSEMAYTYSDESGAGNCKFQNKTTEIEGEAQRKNRKWLWNDLRNGCENVSDTISNRESKSMLSIKSKQPYKDGDKWPAKPGESQYEWEEPRTVKPGVGCTVDGYDFRIDLLRAYGNGVVEQTAEIAFTNLLNKFLKK